MITVTTNNGRPATAKTFHESKAKAEARAKTSQRRSKRKRSMNSKRRRYYCHLEFMNLKQRNIL